SAWVDDLKRSWLRSGFLARLVDAGIRGVTDNPTTFERAVTADGEYDDQIGSLAQTNDPEQSYWELAVHDVAWALEVLRPLHDQSGGRDGFVSLELAPGIAHDIEASVAAAEQLYERVGWPNLIVKVPATKEGIEVIHRLIAAGRNVNVTLVFGLPRYEEVIEAYISGLEERAANGASDLSSVA